MKSDQFKLYHKSSL